MTQPMAGTPDNTSPMVPARMGGALMAAGIVGFDLMGRSIALSSVIFTGALAMYHAAGFALLVRRQIKWGFRKA